MKNGDTYHFPGNRGCDSRRFLFRVLEKWYVSPFFMCLFLVVLTLTLAEAGERKPIRPTPGDKCPVCGMFVAKFPDWNAEIIFKDGSYAVFDGAKDMFKYYLDLKKYNPSKNSGDIDSIYVTDYYDLTLIDGTKAFYVTGSDVHGPMGRELIPFKEEGGAMDFLKDHKGKAVLKFREVTPEIVKGLDD
jgi:copper chaperone NosL